MSRNIKAILFDSGRVLNGPATGHWFITPNFFSYVSKKDFARIPREQKQMAFDKAMQYISKQNLILTEQDEYNHFLLYYTILFNHMPEIKLEESQIEAVTRDLVYNHNKYVFFPDAIQVIDKLHKDYKLAVVSDAWPSLEKVFVNANMKKHFSSFVISSVQGVTKPNELMYRTALNELGIAPEEAVFIDDSIKNCDGAKKIGITSFLLCRDWHLYLYNKITCKNHKVIYSLNSLPALLKRV